MSAVTDQASIATGAKSVHDEFDPPLVGIGLVGKVGIFLAVLIIGMVTSDPLVLGGLLIVVIIVTFTTGLSPRPILAALKPLLPVIVLLFVFSALFYNPAGAQQPYAQMVYLELLNTDFLTLVVSSGGLLFGLGVVLKLLVIMIISIFLIATTPMEQLLAGLQAIRVPNAIGLMLSTAIRFIPTMNAEVATIKDAQRARGAGSTSQPRGRRQGVQGTIPLFVPMIVTSMRRADTMAMSMVSRGYGFTKRRTILARLHTGVWDYLALALAVIAVALFFLGRATLGFGIL